jgi:hypothetical protein
MYITCQEREKKRKKSNNHRQQFTTVSCHTSLQKKKDMTTHLERRRNANYIDRVNGVDATYVLGHAEHAPKH